MLAFSQPYVSVLAAFLSVAVVLLIVGTSLPSAALWGTIAAVFMYVGSHQPRQSDRL